jgi:hypothetical protein
MNVSREEAAQALDDIGKAGDRILQLKGYHNGAPHFIVWGLVWLVANSISQFWPERQQLAWPVGVGIGMISSTALGIYQSRRYPRGTQASRKERWIGSRIAATSFVMFAFIFCALNISKPETSRELNALISIFFPFLYMACGLWAGWRLFAIGFVTAVAIMAGFFLIDEYYWLWMGVFGGGSLIAGGVWLRTA